LRKRSLSKPARPALLSRAMTVADYIAGAPAERREALGLLRRLCLEELAGFEEAMQHGMPSYLRDGAMEVAFASQRAYISLYILRQPAVAANRDALAGLSVGKGCIRFRTPAQIAPDTVRALLRATVADTGPIC
jgi:uncharacterized protein YdhG (YjbR/CyaY superfamily)